MTIKSIKCEEVIVSKRCYDCFKKVIQDKA